jgi:hypothetical protein
VELDNEAIQKMLSDAGMKTGTADSALLEKLKQWAINLFANQMGSGDSAAGAFEKVKEKLIEAGKKGITGINLLLQTTLGRGVNVDTVAHLLGIDSLTKEAGAAFTSVKGFLQDTGVIPLEFSFDAIEDQANAVKKMLGEGAVGKLGLWYATKELADKLKSTREQFITPITGDLDEMSKAAGTIFAARSNPFGVMREDIANSTVSLKTFQRDFAQGVIGLQFDLGIDKDTAMRELTEVYGSLDDASRQLTGFKITGDGQDILGARAIAVAAKAIGVTTGELAADINEMTSRFGLSGEQAAERIMTIGKASTSSGLALSTFKKLVMDSAKDFGAFGDATEESAALLDRFVRNADPSRLRAVTDAFSNVTRGIAGMSDEMKAFVSMGTELSGGGGAIESIVRLEEALQSGDKDALQGIFEETMARIEELTGAPLMTMKEAVQSGQESTYYQQAALAQKFGMASSRAQASDVFEARRTGRVDIDTIKGRAGPGVFDGATREGGLAASAREKAAGTMTAGEIGENLLRGAGLQAKFNAIWASETDSFMAKTQDLGKKAVDAASQFADGSAIFSQYADYIEKVGNLKGGPSRAGQGTATVEQLVSGSAAESVAETTLKNTMSAGEQILETTTKASVSMGEAVTAFASAATAAAAELQSIAVPAVSRASTQAVAAAGGYTAAPGAALAAPPAPAAPPEPIVVKVEVELKGDNVKEMITVKATQVAVDVNRRGAGVSPPPP